MRACKLTSTIISTNVDISAPSLTSRSVEIVDGEILEKLVKTPTGLQQQIWVATPHLNQFLPNARQQKPTPDTLLLMSFNH
jgi:hypothetical protein